MQFTSYGTWKSGMEWPPRFLGDFEIYLLIGYQKFRKNSYRILFPKTCLKTLTVRIFDIRCWFCVINRFVNPESWFFDFFIFDEIPDFLKSKATIQKSSKLIEFCREIFFQPKHLLIFPEIHLDGPGGGHFRWRFWKSCIFGGNPPTAPTLHQLRFSTKNREIPPRKWDFQKLLESSEMPLGTIQMYFWGV